MAGILEEERDPLDFLADYPTPLTSAQRADLAWHKSKLEANRERLKKVLPPIMSRRQRAERFVTEAEDRLNALINGTTATNAAAAAATTVAVGEKRSRDEDTNADVRADEAANTTSTITAAASTVTTSSTAAIAPAATPSAAAAPAPPAAAPRRKFGGAFGGLKGLLADAKKDSSKDEALRKQRDEMARRAEEDKIRGEIMNGQGELADIDERAQLVKDKLDAINQHYEELVAVLGELDTQETAYASAFFLKTKGCTDAVGYEVSFRPAQMTEQMRHLISAQVESALDTYLAFRDRTDAFLVEITEARARKAFELQVQLAEAAAAAAAANGDDAANGANNGVLAYAPNGIGSSAPSPAAGGNGILGNGILSSSSVLGGADGIAHDSANASGNATTANGGALSDTDLMMQMVLGSGNIEAALAAAEAADAGADADVGADGVPAVGGDDDGDDDRYDY